MLPDGDAKKFQSFVKENLAIPHFEHGTHFYLDIDYETYKARGANRKGTEWATVETKNLFDDRRKCPSGTFYVDDGNHRALVYAVHIACGATTYEPVEAIHATSWKGASNELGYQPQDSTALEDNGKLQKSGRSGRMEAITLEEALKTFSDTIKSKPQ